MGLLDGKTILVTGVANRWSIASGIARQLHAHGATPGPDLPGRAGRGRGAQSTPPSSAARPVFPCDVTNDDSLRRVGATRSAGSTASSTRSPSSRKRTSAGRSTTTSRDGFAMAMDISAYSLIALVGHLEGQPQRRRSVMALTYLGATQIVPNYNVAGIAKAALESIVRYLAFDLGARGIRVNAISAGPISTASSRQVAGLLGDAGQGRRRRRRCAATSRPTTSATAPCTWPRISRGRSPPTCTSSTRAIMRWGCIPKPRTA